MVYFSIYGYVWTFARPRDEELGLEEEKTGFLLEPTSYFYIHYLFDLNRYFKIWFKNLNV